MVTTLSASVQQQVLLNEISSTEAVVEVDRCSWAIEEDILLDSGLSRHSLEVERTLLLPQSNLVHKISLDSNLPWLVPCKRDDNKKYASS